MEGKINKHNFAFNANLIEIVKEYKMLEQYFLQTHEMISK